jgi:hypothetical protein
MTEQAKTQDVSVTCIMRSPAFQAGVEDVRAGKYPRFDWFVDNWSYERGRQWAMVAPMSMPLRIGKRLNPKAIDVFVEHVL